jgi:hypothetical protein
MLLPISSTIFTAVGDILIGVSILRVHLALSRERSVDELVIDEVKDEKLLVILGIVFICLGLFLDILFIYLYL